MCNVHRSGLAIYFDFLEFEAPLSVANRFIWPRTGSTAVNLLCSPCKIVESELFASLMSMFLDLLLGSQQNPLSWLAECWASSR